MDLKEAWKTLEKEKLSRPVAGSFAIPGHSKHPVANIILTFMGSVAFCILFEIIFIGLLFFVAEQTIVTVSMVVVILFYGFLLAVNLRVLRNVRSAYRSDDSVLNVLQNVHSIVTQTIRFQEKFSWVFFPICVAAGFVLGLSMTKEAVEMIVQPRFYITLIITMLVMTPLCFYGTRFLVKHSHGKYLKQIEGLIKQMSEV